MTRLLHIAIFTLGMSLFGTGLFIVGSEASPTLAVPDFSTTTTPTTVADMQLSTTSTTAPKRIELGICLVPASYEQPAPGDNMPGAGVPPGHAACCSALVGDRDA